jgi:hypothetical protein
MLCLALTSVVSGLQLIEGLDGYLTPNQLIKGSRFIEPYGPQAADPRLACARTAGREHAILDIVRDDGQVWCGWEIPGLKPDWAAAADNAYSDEQHEALRAAAAIRLGAGRYV